MSSAMLLFGGSWVTLFLSMSLFSIILVLLVQRGKFLYALRNVPYPPALPIIGNGCQLCCSPAEFFEKLIGWAKDFDDIYLVWLGMRPLIFLYRAEAIQPLLSSSVHINKSHEYKHLQPWLGTGLLTSNGDKWHYRRKLLTPPFHSGLFDLYLKTSIRESDILISCLKKEVGASGFDILPYVKRAALDIICDSAMGCQINAQTNCNNEYVVAVNKVAAITQRRFTNVWIAFDLIFKMTSWGKEHDQSLDIIHGFVDKVIADRKAEWKHQRDGNFNEPTKKRQALLDLLLEMSQDGKVLTDMDIREEVNTFMYAGHDTTATSVSWTLYALGRCTQYQEKILEEYNKVVGTKELTLDNLNKLSWLEACIKETWRMYPVAPLIARQINSPITIQGHDIPVGSTVIINSYLLHRDARHFPEPDVFRPERFLPDSPKQPCFAFIPFSAGSRNCIGWRFATAVVKILVLSVLRSFSVKSLDNENQLRLCAELVLCNSDGVRIAITPRER